MKKIIIVFIMGMILGTTVGYYLGRMHQEKIVVVYKDIVMDPIALLNAIIKVESDGNTKAISPKNARGLMQVRYKVWGKEMKKQGILCSEADLHNPRKGVEAGRFILAHYLQKHGSNLPKALKDYSGNANNYTEKVLEAYILDHEKILP